LISFPALIWTGGRAFASLTLALNAMRGDDAPEDAPRRFLVSLGMLAGIGLSFIGALASGVVFDEVWTLLRPLPGDAGPLLTIVRTVARAFTLFVAFGLVYWFVPRGRQDRRTTLIGAGAATVLFMAARPLFLVIIHRSATYQITYGPLALAAILMVWAWVVAFITLFGGQLATVSRAMRTERGSAAGGEEQ
jgi:membrane protein